MLRLAIVSLLLSLTPAPRMYPTGHVIDFGVPSSFTLRRQGKVVTKMPIFYLETYPVSDSNAKLAEGARAKLCRLTRAAYKESKRVYRQDYMLETSVPLMRLILANYSDVGKATVESGQFIFIGDLADALCNVGGKRR